MTTRSARRRRGITVAAAAALGVAATLPFAATAQAANNGGCREQSKDGFKVRTCISRSGQDLVPDAYVLGKPAGCFYLAVDVRDNGSASRSRHEYDRVCGTGKFAGDRVNTFWDLGQKDPYFTEVTIVFNNKSTVFDGWYQD
jgi:hypothetical protein